MIRAHEWAVVGSSPNVRKHLEAISSLSIRTWLTCNRGIELIDPDLYFLSDIVAGQRWGPIARRRNVWTITLKRGDKAIAKRGLEWVHELVREGTPFESFQLSGLWCMEYAARRGADVVHLAGFEGYSDGDHYFDGSKAGTRELTDRIIEPTTQRIVEKYPSVLFVHHGRPNYRISAENWREEI